MVRVNNSVSPYLNTIVYFLFFGIFVAFAASLINYSFHAQNIAADLKNRAETVVEVKEEQVSTFVGKIEKTLFAIDESSILDDYINRPDDPAAKRQLQELMRTVAVANSDFIQVRLLDADGLEKVRIDRDHTSSAVHVIEEALLQDKHERYYYRDSARLAPGSYWHSRVDLNVEHGVIEKPFVPTFRVAMPLYRHDRLHGLLIVNVNMHAFMMSLWSHTAFNIYLIDKEGYYIHHKDVNASWSRYTESKRTLFDDFPAFASEIMAQENFKGNALFAFSLEDRFDNGEMIKMILEPKFDFMAQQRQETYRLVLYLTLLTLAIALPAGGIFAIGPAQLQAKLKDLLKENAKHIGIIDRYVVTAETDLNGNITNVSTAFCKLCGYDRDELIGKHHRVLGSGLTPPKVYNNLWRTITTGEVWRGEISEKSKDGGIYWVETTILPEYDDQHILDKYTVISYDITDKKRVEALSKTDTLTGLGNRAMLDTEMKKELGRAQRYGSAFAVIMMDIDHFKHVNDTYGHLAGDAVLKQVGALIKNGIRVSDRGGRWGGEEFVILCPETTLQDAATLAEKLRKELEELDFGVAGRQTASFGVSAYYGSDSVDAIITRADGALYQAKEQGRNRVISS